jgi:hypothetical protein
MKLKVILLLVFGIIPSALLLRDPTDAHFGYPFYVSYGLLWCTLFTYFYIRTDATQRRKLLWMSPLVLFAFAVPVFVLYVWIAMWVQFDRGGALP